jgi:tetratricopeptide (TPR) repeat protein
MRLVIRVAVVALLAGWSTFAVAMGSSSSSDTSTSAPKDSDYVNAEKAIKAKDYKGAIPLLEQVVAKQPKNADAFNYLGYAHRKLGETEKAQTYYETALDIDPNHLGANEYMGELYLEMDNLQGAESRMAVLDKACRNCPEKRELRDAIEKYKTKKS